MANHKEIVVPDIGGAQGIDVIEVLVKKGDHIEIDTPLITLESDKASMEIPATIAGVVEAINVKIGDKVSQGDVILAISGADAPDVVAVTEAKSEATIPPPVETKSVEPVKVDAPISEPSLPRGVQETNRNEVVFAGPAVRRFAHELGLNLNDVRGSGRKSRITKEDVQLYVKQRLSQPASSSGFSLPSSPVIDFSQFGEIESKALNKIKRLTGANVHRSWITIPHVTQFDEADITDLEAFRKDEAENASAAGYKLTVLAFVCKVMSKALKAFPQFNASLDAAGENLIYKHYVNIGIAVETPNGLVVPVIKGVDRMSVADIAKEMARLSAKARDKGLMPADMSGGSFTISSLGGIGGTAFTPIVNSPEVAILGLSRSSIKPVYVSGEFKPRLMLPLSLSYDHRVIDGAEAARFTRFIAEQLSDIRRVLL